MLFKLFGRSITAMFAKQSVKTDLKRKCIELL